MAREATLSGIAATVRLCGTGTCSRIVAGDMNSDRSHDGRACVASN